MLLRAYCLEPEWACADTTCTGWSTCVALLICRMGVVFSLEWSLGSDSLCPYCELLNAYRFCFQKSCFSNSTILSHVRSAACGRMIKIVRRSLTEPCLQGTVCRNLDSIFDWATKIGHHSLYRLFFRWWTFEPCLQGLVDLVADSKQVSLFPGVQSLFGTIFSMLASTPWMCLFPSRMRFGTREAHKVVSQMVLYWVIRRVLKMVSWQRYLDEEDWVSRSIRE